MSKFNYNISSVCDQNGESEIIMCIYVTRDSRFRIKSGIRIDSQPCGGIERTQGGGGSRAFARYRAIDDDIKKELIGMLE